ncbi:unnamed protein product [Brassica rapa]|uniref:Uncharacterized protein n=1 Tax=Brassica campestris TaxID=3711 RepID=A0A3P5ZPT9_BRACM|nr:unnamed protein product [Brassica rapa]VDC74811.1 unnamed protein product [Brassica rapa]
MEGVGARLGRSSTRYGHGGPATVFTGPVRKWKKKWVHVSPSSKKHSSSSVASDGSHLLFFKWAPLSQGGSGNEDGKSESNSPSEEPVTETTAAEEPPRRRFKYVPIAVLEEQKKEATEIDEEDKVEVEEDDASAVEPREKKIEEKPDMNDVPMEDNQEEEKVVRQDLNESTTDLGLNLNANDADSENNSKGTEPLEE